MIKLTDRQQEVLEKMANGWGMSTDSTMQGGIRIQDGGTGKGGRAESVNRVDFDRLCETGMVRRVKYSFPSSPWDLTNKAREHLGLPLKEENFVIVKKNDGPQPIDSDPVLGDRYLHESYGMLQLSRGWGSPAPLFGSSLQHTGSISLILSHGEMRRRGGNDDYYAKNRIIEVEMSEMQFAQAITSLNLGSGVPVTIRWTAQDGHLERPPLFNKIGQFEKDMKDTTQGFVDNTVAILEKIQKNIDGKKPMGVQQLRELKQDVEVAMGHIKSNMTHVSKQFEKQMEESLTDAKTSLDAYARNLGIETNLLLEEGENKQLEGEFEQC